jgi:DNA repair protein RecO (recombination protein O)
MSIQYSARGFVFGREDKAETDRIFSVFTEEFGRLKIFAKAIRKIKSKLKSGIDIFSVSEIEFIQGKLQKTLTDAVFIKKFSNITSSPRRFKIADKIAKTLDDFIKEQEKDSKLFNFLIDSLDKLNDDYLESKNCNLIYDYFIWNFFSMLGFGPELQKCANCYSKLSADEIYFSCKEGGVICKKCFNSNTDNQAKKINSDAVKILRLILEKDWQIISKLKINLKIQKSMQEVSEDYYFYLLNR